MVVTVTVLLDGVTNVSRKVTECNWAAGDYDNLVGLRGAWVHCGRVLAAEYEERPGADGTKLRFS